ncbi:related to DNA repair protein RAD50 [Saccharomycodes ludwigii]|uniref:DNA repair protein RAD50 n=1 Tax=Saccharomycodes ludwigii TaxID=36035 RepID=A0A376B5Q8_9ASCO|nr:related to DNA repair protein RAD50 [Saccharomycodes ludwigii]
MSSIYKLSIQGIRSFGADDRETIEFGKPLTLIVGTNGSGKTTVIECLKYATTGDLPPNSKGGAFVHDPKITHEKDVRAQVRFSFTSVNGLNMIVTRNIQLIVKKTTTTFKTLEGQLVTVNDQNERSTISTRAAELDTKVPLYMGVPKAILEYVIFCHQEESLWPLSEPSNLKKKFDEIFQAMKFTKAIDNLKVIKKDMGIDIKLLKQSVEHLKSDRNKSKVTKLNITTLQEKIKTYELQVQKFRTQLDEITEQSNKLFDSNQDFQNVLSKLESLRNSKISLQEQIETLTNTVDSPLNMGKSDLLKKLSNFTANLEAKKLQIENWKSNELSKRNANLNNLRLKYDELIKRDGELVSWEKNTNLKKEQLVQTIKIFKEEFDLENVSLDSLTTYYNKLNAEVGNLVEANAIELENSNRDISRLQNEQSIELQSIKYAITDKDKLSHEVAELNKKIANINYTESDIESIKENIRNYQEKLHEIEKRNSDNSFDQKINANKKELISLENEIDIVQQKIIDSNRQSDLMAQFSIIKEDFTSTKSKLAQKAADFKNHTELLKHLEFTIPSDDKMLCSTFKKKFITFADKAQTLSLIYREAQDNYNKSEYSYLSIQENLEEYDKQAQKLRSKIKSILPEDCTIDDYDTILQETEESCQTAVENLKMHKTTLEFNLKALQFANVKNCCYLCQRNFEDLHDKLKLVKELEKRTTSKFEETLKKQVNEEKAYLSDLRKAGPSLVSLKDLLSKIEMTKSEKNLIQEETKKLEALLKDKREQHERTQSLVKQITEVLKPLSEEIARLDAELEFISKKKNNIEKEVSIYQKNGPLETIQELQQKQTRINERGKKLRKEIDELQVLKDSNSKEFDKVCSLLRDNTFKQNEAEKSLVDKKNMELESVKKNDAIKSLTLKITEGESFVAKQTKHIQNLEVELSNKKVEFKAIENETRSIFDTFVKNKDLYINLKNDIHKFDTEGSVKLKHVKEQIEGLKKEMSHITDEIAEFNDKINAATRTLQDSINQEKNLKLNIDLLNLKDKLLSIEQEILKLDVQNAEAKKKEYQQESLRLRNMFEKLNAENAGKLGEIRQLENQIKALTDQLKTDYKDIDAKYEHEWVKLQAKTLVTDDIDTYSKALDSAIMKYHSLKMKDINRIIDELWKKTYSGTDVDTIMIKTDEISNTRGKSYNYRVVMYKQDAELDMRGRCSAGQKVLASIIIRLALSETFGINCGVIALDEPTTNLDEDNIASLAKALHNIIQYRRSQRNFQLIVITHDESFLNYMNASEFTDHFFRVKRDDRQKSQIEWVDINRITG